MAQPKSSRIPCSRETRQLVKGQKRAGETYDRLLRKMVEQYDPEKATQADEDKH